MRLSPEHSKQIESRLHQEEISPSPMVTSRQTWKRVLAIACLFAVDCISLLLILGLSFQLRIHILPAILPIFPESMPPAFGTASAWMAGVLFAALVYQGLYSRRLPFWRETKRVLAALSLSFIIIMAGVSLAKMTGEVSRTVLVLSYFLAVFLFPLNRYLAKTMMLKAGVWSERVLVLGTGQTAKTVSEALLRDHYSGYQIVGFLENAFVPSTNSLEINGEQYPVLGGFREAVKVIAESGIRHVVIAAPEIPGSRLVSITHQIQPHIRSVLVVPDLVGLPVMSGESEYFFDEHIVAFRTRNNLASRFNIVSKRCFDLVVGFILLVLLLPWLLGIALCIKIDSPGPVAFCHRRIGHRGKAFNCYKFRSMQINAGEALRELLDRDPVLKEEWERDFKLKNDPRITRVGKILRRTSLDELPQIFNVIRGEMSLVGPRPIVHEELERFGDYARDYLLVLPGITGLWQVSGRSDIDYEERVAMESWYVRNWSLWLDISLLFRTVGVVLARKGAY